VHRDLAARNVLLAHTHGVNVTAKVADFGLARQLKDGRSDCTAHSLSFRWAAPVVLRHNGHSSASDVWSFGVLCWEVFSLTKSLPWRELSDRDAVVEAVVNRRQTLSPPSACEIWIAVTPCIAYNANERPTFAQLLTTLGKLRADLSAVIDIQRPDGQSAMVCLTSSDLR